MQPCTRPFHHIKINSGAGFRLTRFVEQFLVPTVHNDRLEGSTWAMRFHPESAARSAFVVGANGVLRKAVPGLQRGREYRFRAMLIAVLG